MSLIKGNKKLKPILIGVAIVAVLSFFVVYTIIIEKQIGKIRADNARLEKKVDASNQFWIKTVSEVQEKVKKLDDETSAMALLIWNSR